MQHLPWSSLTSRLLLVGVLTLVAAGATVGLGTLLRVDSPGADGAEEPSPPATGVAPPAAPGTPPGQPGSGPELTTGSPTSRTSRHDRRATPGSRSGGGPALPVDRPRPELRPVEDDVERGHQTTVEIGTRSRTGETATTTSRGRSGGAEGSPRSSGEGQVTRIQGGASLPGSTGATSTSLAGRGGGATDSGGAAGASDLGGLPAGATGDSTRERDQGQVDPAGSADPAAGVADPATLEDPDAEADPTTEEGVDGEDEEEDPEAKDEGEYFDEDYDDPERDERITLYLTLPDRTVSPGESFYVRVELDVGGLQMSAYAATILYVPDIVQILEVLEVPGSPGRPHAGGSSDTGFLVISDKLRASRSGRIPLADVLCQVVGQSGRTMSFGGYASITDMSTGRPVRVKYSQLVPSGPIQVR